MLFSGKTFAVKRAGSKGNQPLSDAEEDKQVGVGSLPLTKEFKNAQRTLTERKNRTARNLKNGSEQSV